MSTSESSLCGESGQTGQFDAAQWKTEQDRLVSMVGDFERKLSQTSTRMTTLENDLKTRTQERDTLKTQVTDLEAQLAETKKTQSNKSATESQIVDEMKQKSEEMLTRAKAIIFEKTKVCKNQELQIEALHQQVNSLKEVVRITRDLLEIRNVEVKHLQDRINGMEAKVEAETERHKLIQGKLDKMVSMNAELKREYETQLCLFSALRERYSERELARGVIAELRPQVRPEVRPEVRDEVRNEVGNEVGNEVRNEVGNEVRNEARNEATSESVGEEPTTNDPTQSSSQ